MVRNLACWKPKRTSYNVMIFDSSKSSPMKAIYSKILLLLHKNFTSDNPQYFGHISLHKIDIEVIQVAMDSQDKGTTTFMKTSLENFEV